MMMAVLETARDSLATITGIASCKVGLESSISPADYPLIRVVPSRLTPGAPYNKRTAECLIYFGSNTAEAVGGMEQVYTDLFTIETAIIGKIKTLGGRYVETITDEDRMQTYKLMAIRCELTG